MTGGSYEELPAELREVLLTADALRARLVRLAQALAVGAETAADRLQACSLTEAGAEDVRLLTKQAHETRVLCREFEERLRQA